MNLNHHHIYVCIYTKYDNNILPQIPKMIVAYLLENPSKFGLYLNNRIHIGMILDKLATLFKDNQEIDILDEIIKLVEVEYGQ